MAFYLPKKVKIKGVNLLARSYISLKKTLVEKKQWGTKIFEKTL